jgi:hypothetical protein
MHPFKTSEGLIPVVAGVGICAADTATGLPEPSALLRAARQALTQSLETGMITVRRFESAQASALES